MYESAVFISEFAHTHTRNDLKKALEAKTTLAMFFPMLNYPYALIFSLLGVPTWSSIKAIQHTYIHTMTKNFMCIDFLNGTEDKTALYILIPNSQEQASE